MDSRKYQLQKQILEAFKAKDSELYTLLKSQWAHRFGVESLEELKNLDLNQMDQNLKNEDNQKIDPLQDLILEDAKEISTEDYDNQEKEITNQNIKLAESAEVEKKESSVNKSYEIVDKENSENIARIPLIDYKRAPEVKALIPLPPKPKYGYFKKWLM
ncbi:hypothetical protein [Prochlorococcus marinus]|uniref:Uncharacterized protein n=1 Tax=Prochlorococcus marinus XMU1408 TaxID=2213228 RepID=A0A318RFB5_PROMR|nr:hypothetical protein [Prochlorococcus marinus]MBW3041475.1 hypothetical protein [Prochlorococcus marinus str. XMU1408]PYE02633.1 hypothetical protein DNJ73_02460 [Prochlorococcus marinus XMU1408]